MDEDEEKEQSQCTKGSHSSHSDTPPSNHVESTHSYETHSAADVEVDLCNNPIAQDATESDGVIHSDVTQSDTMVQPVREPIGVPDEHDEAKNTNDPQEDRVVNDSCAMSEHVAASTDGRCEEPCDQLSGEKSSETSSETSPTNDPQEDTVVNDSCTMIEHLATSTDGRCEESCDQLSGEKSSETCENKLSIQKETSRPIREKEYMRVLNDEALDVQPFTPPKRFPIDQLDEPMMTESPAYSEDGALIIGTPRSTDSPAVESATGLGYEVDRTRHPADVGCEVEISGDSQPIDCTPSTSKFIPSTSEYTPSTSQSTPSTIQYTPSTSYCETPEMETDNSFNQTPIKSTLKPFQSKKRKRKKLFLARKKHKKVMPLKSADVDQDNQVGEAITHALGLDDDLERKLEENAAKNNLTAINVKSILHHVITNEHVLSMVRNTMRDAGLVEIEREPAAYTPKLTRAKLKEATEKVGNMPYVWPLSPVKNKKSTPGFIEINFSDDTSSDDEDYEPTLDELMREESDYESVTSQMSDFGSPCASTPPRSVQPSITEESEMDDSPTPKPSTTDSTSKTSQRPVARHLQVAPVPMGPPPPPPNNDKVGDDDAFIRELAAVTKEESKIIAHRTRSKLTIDKPLEAIEASFVAPDAENDLCETYELDHEDLEWKNWLASLYVTEDTMNTDPTDDEQNDPEYNFLAEEEPLDREDFRTDRAVRVSKKELNGLLDEVVEAYGDEVDWFEDFDMARFDQKSESSNAESSSQPKQKFSPSKFYTMPLSSFHRGPPSTPSPSPGATTSSKFRLGEALSSIMASTMAPEAKQSEAAASPAEETTTALAATETSIASMPVETKVTFKSDTGSAEIAEQSHTPFPQYQQTEISAATPAIPQAMPLQVPAASMMQAPPVAWTIEAKTLPSLKVEGVDLLQMQQQMQQHVQLLTQMYILAREDSTLTEFANQAKQFLTELDLLAGVNEDAIRKQGGENQRCFQSSFRACNLDGALDLLKIPQLEPLYDEGDPKRERKVGSKVKPHALPTDIRLLFGKSSVFIHIEILPLHMFHHISRSSKIIFVEGEDKLVVRGLEMFSKHPECYKLIQSLMMPCKTALQIRNRMKNLMGYKCKLDLTNPIVIYKQTGVVAYSPSMCSVVLPDQAKAPIYLKATKKMPRWIVSVQDMCNIKALASEQNSVSPIKPKVKVPRPITIKGPNVVQDPKEMPGQDQKVFQVPKQTASKDQKEAQIPMQIPVKEENMAQNPAQEQKTAQVPMQIANQNQTLVQVPFQLPTANQNIVQLPVHGSTPSSSVPAINPFPPQTPQYILASGLPGGGLLLQPGQAQHILQQGFLPRTICEVKYVIDGPQMSALASGNAGVMGVHNVPESLSQSSVSGAVTAHTSQIAATSSAHTTNVPQNSDISIQPISTQSVSVTQTETVSQSEPQQVELSEAAQIAMTANSTTSSHISSLCTGSQSTQSTAKSSSHSVVRTLQFSDNSTPSRQRESEPMDSSTLQPCESDGDTMPKTPKGLESDQIEDDDCKFPEENIKKDQQIKNTYQGVQIHETVREMIEKKRKKNKQQSPKHRGFVSMSSLAAKGISSQNKLIINRRTPEKLRRRTPEKLRLQAARRKYSPVKVLRRRERKVQSSPRSVKSNQGMVKLDGRSRTRIPADESRTSDNDDDCIPLEAAIRQLDEEEEERSRSDSTKVVAEVHLVSLKCEESPSEIASPGNVTKKIAASSDPAASPDPKPHSDEDSSEHSGLDSRPNSGPDSRPHSGPYSRPGPGPNTKRSPLQMTVRIDDTSSMEAAVPVDLESSQRITIGSSVGSASQILAANRVQSSPMEPSRMTSPIIPSASIPEADTPSVMSSLPAVQQEDTTSQMSEGAASASSNPKVPLDSDQSEMLASTATGGKSPTLDEQSAAREFLSGGEQGGPGDDAEEDTEAGRSDVKVAAKRIKRKLRKDLESTVVLLDPDIVHSDPHKEEREFAFAKDFLDRVKECLEDKPDQYRDFLKVFNEHSEDPSSSIAQLYYAVKNVLSDRPDLIEEFTAFMPPDVAVQCGVFLECLEFSKARLFLRQVEVHFSKQPAHVQRIIKTMVQWGETPQRHYQDLKEALIPLLKGQPHLEQELSMLFPDSRPPQDYMMDFEEINLMDEKKLPCDDFEEIELSESEDEDERTITKQQGRGGTTDRIYLDPWKGLNDELQYGTRSCKCNCHETSQDSRVQRKARHCAYCSARVTRAELTSSLRGVGPVRRRTLRDGPVRRRRSGVRKRRSKDVATGDQEGVGPAYPSNDAVNHLSQMCDNLADYLQDNASATEDEDDIEEEEDDGADDGHDENDDVDEDDDDDEIEHEDEEEDLDIGDEDEEDEVGIATGDDEDEIPDHDDEIDDHDNETDGHDEEEDYEDEDDDRDEDYNTHGVAPPEDDDGEGVAPPDELDDEDDDDGVDPSDYRDDEDDDGEGGAPSEDDADDEEDDGGESNHMTSGESTDDLLADQSPSTSQGSRETLPSGNSNSGSHLSTSPTSSHTTLLGSGVTMDTDSHSLTCSPSEFRSNAEDNVKVDTGSKDTAPPDVKVSDDTDNCTEAKETNDSTPTNQEQAKGGDTSASCTIGTQEAEDRGGEMIVPPVMVDDGAQKETDAGAAMDPGQSATGESTGTVSTSIWNREADRVLLQACQEKGASEETFLSVATQLTDKTTQQVRERFSILMKLFQVSKKSNESSDEEDDEEEEESEEDEEEEKGGDNEEH